MGTAKVLVTGGAGYIGRCMVEYLINSGQTPVILDNFSTGSKAVCEGLEYFDVDLVDREATEKAISQVGEVSAVIHFAAKALVAESVTDPISYFRNNVVSTINLSDACLKFGIKNFVFSSSCAVYGIPSKVPIEERSSLNPVSPYGESKKMCEQVLSQVAQTKELSVACLRYFNPAGAYQGKFGERHEPETHLIPNLVKAAKTGEVINLYGTDYPTSDGTCVRDFIHIEDLVEAHAKACAFLDEKPGLHHMNLGTGVGVSVRQAIETTQKALGKEIKIVEKPRRTGDPPELIADPSFAQESLGWRATRTLDQMVHSQANFQTK